MTDWIDADARTRLASYTNLAPGEYQFRMRARTTDSSVGGSERVLRIRVAPYWWQTRWAQVLALLVLVAGVSAMFFGRLRMLARQRQRLSEQVAQATAQSTHALAQMHSAHRELAQAYERIEQLSRTDALTGVGNRRLLDQRLPQLLAPLHSATPPAGRLAFLLLDIDSFKALNDRHGHAAGDAVLSALGALLRSLLPEDSGMVVRWGGEEFLVVQSAADEAAAVQGAERLRAAVATLTPELVDGQRMGGQRVDRRGLLSLRPVYTRAAALGAGGRTRRCRAVCGQTCRTQPRLWLALQRCVAGGLRSAAAWRSRGAAGRGWAGAAVRAGMPPAMPPGSGLSVWRPGFAAAISGWSDQIRVVASSR